MTLTEQINAIAYEGLTEENFQFLKERALKSVRKNSGTGKRGLTKTQKDNVGYKEKIVALLVEQGGMTATQVGEKLGWKGSQKASALLGQLVKEGKVNRTEEGRVTLFTAVEVEEEEEEGEDEQSEGALSPSLPYGGKALQKVSGRYRPTALITVCMIPGCHGR